MDNFDAALIIGLKNKIQSQKRIIEKMVRREARIFIKLMKAEGFSDQKIEKHIKQVISKREKEHDIR